MSPKKKHPIEEAEIIENTIDNNDKRIVVYSEYDQHFQSPLRRKRVRMSFMDMLVVGFILLIL